MDSTTHHTTQEAAAMTTETRTEITVTITPEESRLIIHALAALANFYSRDATSGRLRDPLHLRQVRLTPHHVTEDTTP